MASPYSQPFASHCRIFPICVVTPRTRTTCPTFVPGWVRSIRVVRSFALLRSLAPRTPSRHTPPIPALVAANTGHCDLAGVGALPGRVLLAVLMASRPFPRPSHGSMPPRQQRTPDMIRQARGQAPALYLPCGPFSSRTYPPTRRPCEIGSQPTGYLPDRKSRPKAASPVLCPKERGGGSVSRRPFLFVLLPGARLVRAPVPAPSA